MTDAEETAYEMGTRAGLLSIMRECIRQLGDDPEANAERWRVEKEAVRVQLRLVCAEFGDNDWPDDLHLADVIEKHLADHLWEAGK